MERSRARATGLAQNAPYPEALEADVNAAREAYIGLAVTEIATVLGQLFGRLAG